MSDVIAGGITGVLQWVIGHPIDTIKVLMQNNMKWSGLPLKQYYNGGSYKLVGSFIFNTIVFPIDDRVRTNFNIDNRFISDGCCWWIRSVFGSTLIMNLGFSFNYFENI